MIVLAETVQELDASLDKGREKVFIRLQDGSRTGSRCADEEEKKVKRDFVSGWETRVLYWSQIFESPYAQTTPLAGAPLAPFITNRTAVSSHSPILQLSEFYRSSRRNQAQHSLDAHCMPC